MALRELDAAGMADKSVFGLDAPDGTLAVTRRGETLTLNVGGETWGSRDRYVGLDQKVFLVDDADLRPLLYGKTRLVERNLQPLVQADVESIAVTRGTETVGFVQSNRQDPSAAFWALAASPEQESSNATTWLAKLFRLKVQTYADPAVAPPELEPAFAFTATGSGETWSIEILREKGVLAPEYYARSTFNRGLVKVTKALAAETTEDLDAVLEGRELPPEAPPAPHGNERPLPSPH
jgi:hypothetical protein